jgi:hypothetical protein
MKLKLQSLLYKSIQLTPDELIKTLNPILIGWGNYYKMSAASVTFKRMDFYLRIPPLRGEVSIEQRRNV